MRAGTVTCPLPYGDGGLWTDNTTRVAQQCVLDKLKRDLGWWKLHSCRGRQQPAKADLDGTLCRLRAASPRSSLTNLLLLSSVGGKLLAMIMLDPSDPRGPMRHWPGRTIAALQQLSELQERIQARELPPLPDFTAILNPHDEPYQLAGNNWCGLVPIISNAHISGVHRDLLMPDFSFAPLAYLTNMLDANLSASLAVPRGWPAEREAIYAAGRRIPWSSKTSTLFWRGGATHNLRRVYAQGFTSGSVHLGDSVKADVALCGSHCSHQQGVSPESWCSHQQLLSLPGRSFAVGFKYTMLCSSTVVRGAHPVPGCSHCPKLFEQWWQSGLKDGEHYLVSQSVEDLSKVLARAAADPRGSSLIAARGSAYVYHVLSPSFVTAYWHELLAGYAAIYSGRLINSSLEACKTVHRKAPQNERERTCFRGIGGVCHFKVIGGSVGDGFIPIPMPSEVATECSNNERMQAFYRRYAVVVPMRLTGKANNSEMAQAVLQAWLHEDSRAENLVA